MTEVCIGYDTYDSLGSFVSAQFLRPDMTDVEIVVTSIEQPKVGLKTFPLHRFILSQATFFRTLFSEPWARKSNRVALVDGDFISIEVVDLLFKLLYVDRFPDFEKQISASVLPLFHISDKVGFDRLKKYCGALISAGINSNNVLRCLSYCILYGNMENSLIYTSVVQWLKLFFFFSEMCCEENIRLFDVNTFKILYESPELNCFNNGKQFLRKMFEGRTPECGINPSIPENNYFTRNWLFIRD